MKKSCKLYLSNKQFSPLLNNCISWETSVIILDMLDWLRPVLTPTICTLEDATGIKSSICL